MRMTKLAIEKWDEGRLDDVWIAYLRADGWKIGLAVFLQPIFDFYSHEISISTAVAVETYFYFYSHVASQWVSCNNP